MDILYLSHCVPNPPNKGERIRAFHEVEHLRRDFNVHVACFSRGEEEALAAVELSSRCASLHAEPMSPRGALLPAGLRFLCGGSITAAYYGSRRLKERVKLLADQVRPSVVVVYSSAMAQYAPPGIPMVLDLVDVDSEKWLQYSRVRRPGYPYQVESGRLRRLEAEYAKRATVTYLATGQETSLFRTIAPDADVRCMENGVDLEYFHPARAPALAALSGRRFLMFLGAMDYFPNADAVEWFAASVFGRIRAADPGAEFLIVGRNPTPAVKKLAGVPGITVTGEVDDVRPYLAAARAVAAPLRIARGIQNKVLEALAMGKPVLASEPVCKTFGADLPAGLEACPDAASCVSHALELLKAAETPRPEIREEACRRYSWPDNLAQLATAVHAAAALDA